MRSMILNLLKKKKYIAFVSLILLGIIIAYNASDSFSQSACPSCSSQDVWKDGCGALNQCVDAVVFEELACCYGVNEVPWDSQCASTETPVWTVYWTLTGTCTDPNVSNCPGSSEPNGFGARCFNKASWNYVSYHGCGLLRFQFEVLINYVKCGIPV